MKNPNKYGTIYKLTGKRRRPYIARAYSGKDENGKSIYTTIGYYATKTEAKKYLAQYNENPYNITNKKITLKELFELFKKDHEKYMTEKSFKYNYEYIFNKALKPLHNEKFSELRPLHYQRIIDDLASIKKKTYLNKIKTLLGLLYKYALMNDIINKDYSKGIRINGQLTTEQDYMTPKEVKKLMDGLNSVKNADIVLLLCLGGFRPSELLNIKKENIDLNNNVIFNVGIKTNAGRSKRVPISSIIKPYLLDRYNNADNYLFTNSKGFKMNYDYFITNIYKPVLKTVKIDYKSPKACRHFLATISKEKGVNDKVRKSILGHTKIELTDNVYTHLQDNYNNKEYEKIDNYLKNI